MIPAELRDPWLTSLKCDSVYCVNNPDDNPNTNPKLILLDLLCNMHVRLFRLKYHGKITITGTVHSRSRLTL